MGHAFIAACDAEQVLEEPRFSSSTPALQQTEREGGCSPVLPATGDAPNKAAFPSALQQGPQGQWAVALLLPVVTGSPTKIMDGEQEGRPGSSLVLQNSC